MIRIVIFFLLLFLLAACREAGQAREVKKSVKKIESTSTLDAEAAFRLTYGDGTMNEKGEWLCKLDHEGTDSYDGLHHMRIDTLYHFSNKRNERFILAVFYSKKYTSASMPEDEIMVSCHGCGAILGMTLFKLENNNWVIKQSNPLVGEYGDWGRIGILYSPEKFGDQVFFQMAIDFQSGGETIMREAIIFIGENIPINDKRILWVDQYYDNAAGRPEHLRYSYEGASRLDSLGSEIYFIVRFKGTRMIEDDTIIEGYDQEDTYHLNKSTGVFQREIKK